MSLDKSLSGSAIIHTGTFSGGIGNIARGLSLMFFQTLLICVLIAGTYFSLPWLKLAFDKPIQRVVIRGDLVALDKKAVEDAVVIVETDTFLGIDLDELVKQLERHPWVERARAKRQWPDTVEIEIVEEMPIAYWGDQWMVNAKGRIFEHQGLQMERALPRLWSDSAIPAETMSYYQIFSHQLQPVGLRLRGISQNIHGDWKLSLDNGMDVILDRADPVSNVRYFVALYQKVVSVAALPATIVDMRYRHGAAIRWQQAEPGEPVPDKNVGRSKT